MLLTRDGALVPLKDSLKIISGAWRGRDLKLAVKLTFEVHYLSENRQKLCNYDDQQKKKKKCVAYPQLNFLRKWINPNDWK
jgi:hypothetical protein